MVEFRLSIGLKVQINPKTQVSLHYFKITLSVQITASSQEISDFKGVGKSDIEGRMYLLHSNLFNVCMQAGREG